MGMIHWREAEAVPLKPGISVYRLSCGHSFGFILNLDTVYCRLRYSKRIKQWFWQYERREPLAWRMLKENDDYNN